MDHFSAPHGRTTGSSTEEVAANIEAFLRSRFRVAEDDAGFTRSAHLWEEGYVDSIGVVELVSHIETTFGVTLPDEAFFDPEFTSVAGIARIIAGLTSQNAA